MSTRRCARTAATSSAAMKTRAGSRALETARRLRPEPDRAAERGVGARQARPGRVARGADEGVDRRERPRSPHREGRPRPAALTRTFATAFVIEPRLESAAHRRFDEKPVTDHGARELRRRRRARPRYRSSAARLRRRRRPRRGCGDSPKGARTSNATSSRSSRRSAPGTPRAATRRNAGRSVLVRRRQPRRHAVREHAEAPRSARAVRRVPVSAAADQGRRRPASSSCSTATSSCRSTCRTSGGAIIDVGSDAFFTLQTWLENGATENGLKPADARRATASGACSTAIAAGLQRRDVHARTRSSIRSRSEVQPILHEPQLQRRQLPRRAAVGLLHHVRRRRRPARVQLPPGVVVRE